MIFLHVCKTFPCTGSKYFVHIPLCIIGTPDKAVKNQLTVMHESTEKKALLSNTQITIYYIRSTFLARIISCICQNKKKDKIIKIFIKYDEAEKINRNIFSE